MRTIKFRTWIEKHSGYSWILDKGKEGYVYELESTIDFEVVGFNTPGLIWEQFTGLTDKNGVEIYEGDVVEYELTLSISKFTVVFDEYKARFYFKDNDGNWGVNSDDVSKKCEVIGNIHES